MELEVLCDIVNPNLGTLVRKIYFDRILLMLISQTIL